MSNDILVKVGADITDFSRKMADSNRSLQDFGNANQRTFDSFKKTGKTITGTGVLLSSGLGFAVKKAADFESGMSQVKAISGATGDDFQALSDVAREMGSSTSFSATEAADGLSYMALAGWDTQQMIGGIEPILHLAEAGALDLGRASDLVTDSMSAMGIEVQDLEGYLDKVAATSSNANTDIDALMEAFVIAGGTFDRFNVPLEEANAFLGVMANRGFKGSEAGTALNAIMARLTSGTGEASKALDAMGISAFDSEGNFRGMEEVMLDVKGALDEMDDETRAHYETQLAGLNHGKSFSAMLAGLGDEYFDLKDSVENSNGALGEMRDIMKDNLIGALENLGSAFEEVLIVIGDALLPAVKQLVEWVQNLADWFNGLSDETKTTIAIVGALTTAFMLVLGPILLLIGYLPNIISGFSMLRTVFLGTTAPVLAIIAVLALLGAAIYELWQSNEEFRNNVQAIWEHIKTIFTSVFEAASEGVLMFIAILAQLVQDMMPVIAAVTEAVAAFLGWIVTFMETHTWVSQVIAILTTAIGVVGFLAAGVATAAQIVGAIVLVFQKVWSIVTLVIGPLVKLWGIVKKVGVIFAFLNGPIGVAIAAIISIGGIIVWLGGKFEWIGNIVDTVTGWMSDAWNGFLDFLGFGTEKAAESAGTSITNLAGTTAQSTAEAAQSAETNIGGMHESMNTHFDGMNQYGVGQLNQLNTQGSSEMQSLNYTGVMELSGLATEGQASLGNLNTSGTSEMQNLHLTGAAEMAGLSTDSQSSMNEMAVGSTSEVAGMNTDITSMLSDLESSGSIDMESLNANVTGDIGDMSSMSMEEISELTSSGASDFSGLESDMTSSASNMQSEVESSFSGMSSTIESEMSNIESTASSSLDGLASNFKSSMSDISNAINSSMQDVAKSTQKGMQAVTNAATKGMQQTSRAINQGTTRMNTDVTRSMTQMQRVYTQGFTRIAALTRSNMTMIVSVTNSGMSSVNAAFSNGMNRSASISQSTGNRIVSIFNRLQAQLRSAGANAMAGLQSGLNSRSGGVMNTARRIADNVASTMRKALKVHSPSRITRAIGAFTGEGLELGLIRSQSSVIKAADGLAEAAKPNVDMSYATPNGAYGTMASAVKGAVSVNTSSKDRALVGAINDLRRDLTNLRVEMEGETVGRIARPHINEGNAKDELGRYFG